MKTGVIHSDQDSQQTTTVDLKSTTLMEHDASQSENPLTTQAPTEGMLPPNFLSATDYFHKMGIPIAEWARARHFNVRLVYSVVRGERKCLRGESYKIAKELGMK